MQSDADFPGLKTAFDQVRGELAKTVVGQNAIVEQLMISLLSQGHCLFEGPPGAAKSLVAASLARVLGLTFDRIRCTPDLSPQDVVGLGVAPTGSGEVPGPIFASIVLVDDFSRLSPKTDCIIQQAIQEDRVVLDGRRHSLPDPFLVLATRYPDQDSDDLAREHHDDRFMMKIAIGYPDYENEYELAEVMSSPAAEPLEQVVAPENVRTFRELARQAEAAPRVIHYAMRLVRSTRVHEGETPDFIYEWVDFGAGPRAAHYLVLAAKMRAALHGRSEASPADVQAVAHPVLRHRIIANRNARSNGVTVDRIIRRLLYETPERYDGDEQRPESREIES
jgi:MoxR-like ATPase